MLAARFCLAPIQCDNLVMSVPVVIVTGFLGAGKTTLLNHLLQDPAMANAAVIINEFGDVSLDHLLIESSDDSIVELSSGCICCTIRGELIETLERLFERQSQEDINRDPLKAIVIETTGLADPVPVMKAVMAHPVLHDQLHLSGVVSVVDAVNGLETLGTHDVAVTQVAVADRMLVAKCDLVGGMIPDDLKSRLRALNPTAIIRDQFDALFDGLFDEGDSSFAQQIVQEVTPSKKGHSHHAGHGEGIKTFTIFRDHPIEKAALTAFLDLLASAHGPQLLRMKGLVHVREHPDKPVLLHGVQNIFHPPKMLDQWPDDNQQSRLVFITNGLNEDFVKRLYDGFCGVPQIDMADKDVLLDNPLAITGFKSR
ncbi:MAG: GTP-binding protein [Hyphomicrobiales bacterium]